MLSGRSSRPGDPAGPWLARALLADEIDIRRQPRVMIPLFLLKYFPGGFIVELGFFLPRFHPLFEQSVIDVGFFNIGDRASPRVELHQHLVLLDQFAELEVALDDLALALGFQVPRETRRATVTLPDTALMAGPATTAAPPARPGGNNRAQK